MPRKSKAVKVKEELATAQEQSLPFIPIPNMSNGSGQINQVTVTGIPALSTTLHAVVNEYSVLAIPTVFRLVTFISGTLAGLPKYVSKQNGTLYQTVNHLLNKLFNRKINPFTTPFTFFETLYHHALLWGNGYALIDNTGGKINGIYNLDPELVTPFKYDGAMYYYVKNLLGPGQAGIVSADQMIHIKGISYDALQGFPVVVILAECFQWARNILKFQARYMQRGTQVQGSIEVPAGVTQTQIDQMRDQIARKHSGIESNYDFLILSGGASLKNNTVSPQESQLIETAESAAISICQILGVSPWYAYQTGNSGATWGNSDQIARDLVKFDLRRWIEKTEEEFADKLLSTVETNNDLVIRFQVEDLLRGDPTAITTNAINQCNNGLITVNEARAELGRAALADPTADELRIPVNFPLPLLQDAQNAPPTPPMPQKGIQAAAEPLKTSFSPIMEDIAERIRTKTEKAFSKKGINPPKEWLETFGGEQGQFCISALAPLGRMNVFTMDQITSIANSYSNSIREGKPADLLKLIGGEHENNTQ